MAHHERGSLSRLAGWRLGRNQRFESEAQVGSELGAPTKTQAKLAMLGRASSRHSFLRDPERFSRSQREQMTW
jgi:hypothetical protein